MRLFPSEPKPQPQIIVMAVGKSMSDAEVSQAFAVGPETLWWRALIQEIEDLRADSIAAAASHGATNNALALAGAVGGHEILTTLLHNLNERREEAVQG